MSAGLRAPDVADARAGEPVAVSERLCQAHPAQGSGKLADDEKRALSKQFDLDVQGEIDRLAASPVTAGSDIAAIKMAVRRNSLQLAARSVKGCLYADLSDYGGPGLTLDRAYCA